MNELKDVLKYLRNRDGISQAELALRLGITPSAIGNYESGTRMPSSDIEEALADYFNVSLDFLRGIDSDRHGLSDEDKSILAAYHKADELTKEMVLRILCIDGGKIGQRAKLDA